MEIVYILSARENTINKRIVLNWHIYALVNIFHKN